MLATCPMSEDTDFDTSWIDEFAGRCKVANLADDTTTALLDIAAEAAHGSGDRRNAPLACFLAGFALGQAGQAHSGETVRKYLP